MFNLFQMLKGRSGLASLFFFVLVFAGWAAFHAFGPHINPVQDQAAITAFFVVLGAFVTGLSLCAVALGL
jgi:hypothetical protein